MELSLLLLMKIYYITIVVFLIIIGTAIVIQDKSDNIKVHKILRIIVMTIFSIVLTFAVTLMIILMCQLPTKF